MTYKSFRITSFADPHHLNPIESHLSKKGGEGEGGPTPRLHTNICPFPVAAPHASLPAGPFQSSPDLPSRPARGPCFRAVRADLGPSERFVRGESPFSGPPSPDPSTFNSQLSTSCLNTGHATPTPISSRTSAVCRRRLRQLTADGAAAARSGGAGACGSGE